MGAGKTAVGRELAGLLDKQFLDLDAAIELMAGKTIKEIFADNGEESFRQLESSCLQTRLAEDLVISVGGGTFVRPENIKLIKELATSIWLKASLGTCALRVKNDPGNRPLFKDDESTRELFDHRLDFYKQADHHIDAGQGSPLEIAREIVAILQPPS